MAEIKSPGGVPEATYTVASSSFSDRITTIENAGGAGTPLGTSVPQSINNSGSVVGSSLSASRADHAHFHGYLSGGGFHAIATILSAGFMDSTDRVQFYYLTSTLGSFTASYLITSASFASRITSVEAGSSINTGSLVTTASFDAFTGSYTVTSASFSTRVTSLESASSSFVTNINTLTNASSAFASRITSNETQISNINPFTASVNTLTQSLNSFTASMNLASSSFASNINLLTTSVALFSATFINASSAFAAQSSSYVTTSASFQSRITTLEGNPSGIGYFATTASFDAFTGSYTTTSASFSVRISDLEAGDGGGGFPLGTQTPQSVVENGNASAGVRVSSSREDHTHAHGNLTGETLHAVATTASSGFFSSSDKQTFNNVTASLPLFSATFVSTSASLITASSSFGSRLTLLETASSSFVTTSASFQGRITTLETASSSFATTVNTLTNASSAFATVSASYVVTSASFDFRINNITASIAAHSAAYLDTSASFETRINTLVAASSAFAAVSASYITTSASLASRTSILELASSSFASRITSLESTSSSFTVSIDALTAASASFVTSIATLTNASSAFATVSASYVNASASFQSRITSLESGGTTVDFLSVSGALSGATKEVGFNGQEIKNILTASMQYLNVGGIPSGSGRAYFKSMATAFAPTEFMQDDVVIGRSASSDVDSGALFFRFNDTGGYSVIGSLSPSVAWLPLLIGATRTRFFNGAGTSKMSTPGVQSSNLTVGSDVVFGWSSTTDAENAPDSAFERLSAGVVGVTDGAGTLITLRAAAPLSSSDVVTKSTLDTFTASFVVVSSSFASRVTTLEGASPGGGSGGGILDVQHFQAESFDEAGVGWYLTMSAPIVDASGSSNGVFCRGFSGTFTSSVGGKFRAPKTATTCSFEWIYQASLPPGATANKVQWRLDMRPLGTTGTPFVYSFTVQTNPNNSSFNVFSQSVGIDTLGLTASLPFQFQLTRISASVSNQMDQAVNLSELITTWT